MSKRSAGQPVGRSPGVIPSDVEESAPTVTAVLARMAEITGDKKAAYDLMSLLFDQPRHWPTIASEEVLSDADAARAIIAAQKLAAGMPIQYAANKAVFRHHTLYVDERVLIPRPETEVLVDIVLEATQGERGGTVVDIGTGSGAIALALATEGTFDCVIATDISADALSVARMNATRVIPSEFEESAPPQVDVQIPQLRASRSVRNDPARLDFRLGSLLTAVPERGLRAVVSNPPYIAFDEADALPALVRDWEPSVALFAGNSGNAVATAIIRDAADVLMPGGILALEVDVRRAGELAEYAASRGSYQDIRVVLDLTGRERFVVATRRNLGDGR